MELRHLRYFVAAAQEENFGRASERLHVTRPAVSQLISDFEEELGALVFERFPHRVRLTAAGKALLPEVQRILEELEVALTLARNVSEGRCGRLSIGYGHQTLMHAVFQDVVQRYHCLHSGVVLDLLEVPTPDQPRAMVEGRVDAAFMHFGPARDLPRDDAPCSILSAEPGSDGLSLEWVPIQTSRLGVLVPVTHRFAKRAAVTLRELADEALVDVPRSSYSVRAAHVLKQCRISGFEPNVVQEVERIPAQLNLVAAGMGIALGVCGAHFTYPDRLRVVPLADVNWPVSFVFAWVRNRVSPALQQMIELLREACPTATRGGHAVPLIRARA